jgi:hypothetical protein
MWIAQSSSSFASPPPPDANDVSYVREPPFICHGSAGLPALRRSDQTRSTPGNGAQGTARPRVNCRPNPRRGHYPPCEAGTSYTPSQHPLIQDDDWAFTCRLHFPGPPSCPPGDHEGAPPCPRRFPPSRQLPAGWRGIPGSLLNATRLWGLRDLLRGTKLFEGAPIYPHLPTTPPWRGRPAPDKLGADNFRRGEGRWTTLRTFTHLGPVPRMESLGARGSVHVTCTHGGTMCDQAAHGTPHVCTRKHGCPSKLDGAHGTAHCAHT